jgi:hypothetical protein
MSRQDSASVDSQQGDDQKKGPNLTLFYSLLGMALLAAIAIATLVVLPFYRQRH